MAEPIGRGWRRAAAATVAGLCLCRPAGATEADPTAAVRVSVEDPGGAVSRELARARAIVGDIYREAGVTVEWVDVPETGSDVRTLRVVIQLSTTLAGALATEAMGVAPSPGDGTRGSLAYVFGDRVAAFAQRYRLSASSVLAGAIAHELGHLLLPVNAHSAVGLMRPAWNPADFPPRAPGLAGFDAQQARLLRLRVLSR